MPAKKHALHAMGVLDGLFSFLQQYGYERPFSQSFFMALTDSKQSEKHSQENWRLYWAFRLNQFGRMPLFSNDQVPNWFHSCYTAGEATSMLMYSTEISIALETLPSGHTITAVIQPQVNHWSLYQSLRLGKLPLFQASSQNKLIDLTGEQFSQLCLQSLQVLRDNESINRSQHAFRLLQGWGANELCEWSGDEVP